MAEQPIKNYPTLGCCGLDCGLCPRYYTEGSSRCPGCCGPDFFNKHPSCPYITCCVKKKELEVCAQCDEFPCTKFDAWLETEGVYDSFLTYKKVKTNMDLIKAHGLEKFIEQQTKRIKLFETMIQDFNDGRSRNFYCLAATLLLIKDLETALEQTEQKIETEKISSDDFNTKSKILKGILSVIADKKGIELKLRKKPKAKS